MDLHVSPGDQLTAERWNALVDLASGKSRPIEYRFSVPKRASGSELAVATIDGNWTEHNTGSPYYETDYWTTNATLENGQIVTLRSPRKTKPRFISTRVLAWKNGDMWEMIEPQNDLTLHAEGTVSGNDLILEFYLD